MSIGIESLLHTALSPESRDIDALLKMRDLRVLYKRPSKPVSKKRSSSWIKLWAAFFLAPVILLVAFILTCSAAPQTSEQISANAELIYLESEIAALSTEVETLRQELGYSYFQPIEENYDCPPPCDPSIE